MGVSGWYFLYGYTSHKLFYCIGQDRYLLQLMHWMLQYWCFCAFFFTRQLLQNFYQFLLLFLCICYVRCISLTLYMLYLFIFIQSNVCLWSHNSRGRLDDLVAEHLDHMHYLNDILSLDISALNDVLTEHLLNRLLVPLYVFSLVDESHGITESVCFMCH